MPTSPTSQIWALAAALAVASVCVPAFANEPGPRALRSQKDPAAGVAGRFAGWTVSMERGARDAAYICGELPVVDRWSLVGCGSGSGFLYEPLPGETDLAHFRAQYAFSMRAAGLPALELRPGLGLMELQRGRDRPGLVFAPDRDTRLDEAAGPEASLEVKWGPSTEAGPLRRLRLSWQSGVAWVPGAPMVSDSPSPTVLFSTLAVNGRF